MTIFDYTFVIVLLAFYLGITLYLFYVLNKRFKQFSHDKLIDLGMDMIAEIMEDEEMQKQIYKLGGIVGAGFGKNVGSMIGGGGQKSMKLNDLIPVIVGQFLGGGFQTQPATTAVPEQPANNGSNKDAIIKRLTE